MIKRATATPAAIHRPLFFPHMKMAHSPAVETGLNAEEIE